MRFKKLADKSSLLFIGAALILIGVFVGFAGFEKTKPTEQRVHTVEEIAVQSEVINLNTATVEELSELDGIGEALAKAIVKHREENGGFSSLEEVLNVSGIGEKKLKSIEHYVVIE